VCATLIKWSRRERELDHGCLMSPLPKANCPPPLHTLLPHPSPGQVQTQNTKSYFEASRGVLSSVALYRVCCAFWTCHYTFLTYGAVWCRDGLERRGRWCRGSGRDGGGARSHGGHGSSRRRERSRSRSSRRKCRGGYRGRGSRRGSHCIRSAGGGGGTRRGSCSVAALLALVSQALHVLRQLPKPVRLHLLS
jgi:hypothetical protein